MLTHKNSNNTQKQNEECNELSPYLKSLLTGNKNKICFQKVLLLRQWNLPPPLLQLENPPHKTLVFSPSSNPLSSQSNLRMMVPPLKLSVPSGKLSLLTTTAIGSLHRKILLLSQQWDLSTGKFFSLYPRKKTRPKLLSFCWEPPPKYLLTASLKVKKLQLPDDTTPYTTTLPSPLKWKKAPSSHPCQTTPPNRKMLPSLKIPPGVNPSLAPSTPLLDSLKANYGVTRGQNELHERPQMGVYRWLF